MTTELREISTGTVGTHGGVDLLSGYHAGDAGNAERLKALYGGMLRRCDDMRKWLYYDGQRWKPDRGKKAVQFALNTILATLDQAHRGNNEDAFKEARKSLSAQKLKSMLYIAEALLPIYPEDFDKDHFLLNCQNGTVDLRTGKLQDHRSADFLTKITPVDYDPDAPRDLFTKFIYQVLGLDEKSTEEDLLKIDAKVDWIGRAAGYSATGSTREKAIIVLYGKGDNGKTTFLEAMKYVLGTYAGQIKIESLTHQTRFGENNTTQADLADLNGKRFVTTSEAQQGSRLAEAKLKYLSQGMGEIKACRKYENPITFTATHSLWLDTNVQPTVSGQDQAIWARLKVLAFTVTLPEIDKDFLEKLKAIAPGILAWIVEGCLRWQKVGLEDLAEIAEAVKKWREDNNPLKNFIEERCELDTDKKEELMVSRSALWKNYRVWAKDQGIQYPLLRKEFIEQLEFQGCVQGQRTINGKVGVWAWSGITFKLPLCNPEEEPPEDLEF